MILVEKDIGFTGPPDALQVHVMFLKWTGNQGHRLQLRRDVGRGLTGNQAQNIDEQKNQLRNQLTKPSRRRPPPPVCTEPIRKIYPATRDAKCRCLLAEQSLLFLSATPNLYPIYNDRANIYPIANRVGERQE